MPRSRDKFAVSRGVAYRSTREDHSGRVKTDRKARRSRHADRPARAHGRRVWKGLARGLGCGQALETAVVRLAAHEQRRRRSQTDVGFWRDTPPFPNAVCVYRRVKKSARALLRASAAPLNLLRACQSGARATYSWQHRLCFLPLPHGQGSFLPTLVGAGRGGAVNVFGGAALSSRWSTHSGKSLGRARRGAARLSRPPRQRAQAPGHGPTQWPASPSRGGGVPRESPTGHHGRGFRGRAATHGVDPGSHDPGQVGRRRRARRT